MIFPWIFNEKMALKVCVQEDYFIGWVMSRPKNGVAMSVLESAPVARIRCHLTLDDGDIDRLLYSLLLPLASPRNGLSVSHKYLLFFSRTQVHEGFKSNMEIYCSKEKNNIFQG